MRTLEEAMVPRLESKEDLMRGPFERELSISAGPHMGKRGKLWYYDPSDNYPLRASAERPGEYRLQ